MNGLNALIIFSTIKIYLMLRFQAVGLKVAKSDDLCFVFSEAIWRLAASDLFKSNLNFFAQAADFSVFEV